MQVVLDALLAKLLKVRCLPEALAEALAEAISLPPATAGMDGEARREAALRLVLRNYET